ncbi:MAG TPA: hypothetical protein VFG83_03240 [Kofleriaceae bacterium]|nr:hypothetical protein [Kofleriaceae bacterium]
MPDYAKLRDLTSHRITINYDTGARIVGYLGACRPARGPVQLISLSRVDMFDADGNILETHDELSVCPNALVGVNLAEGPEGRDL